MAQMSVKDELHDLVERLSDSGAAEALSYLRELADERPPRFTTDQAPLDDEPETEEERAAVAKAKAQRARGQVISAEEAKRRLLA
jgi:hypothetical protein